mmetsp:Transcript_33841/g.65015  ORF Transcript_33841/g.65015 Transcript_33841/m.65015 type:complete len:529 (-) Transcript_33841:349-1935(-)
MSTKSSQPSKSSNSRPLYHPVRNPPYQINYRSKRCGKHLSLTKRRITFLFGFSDASAIAAGKSGNECRGPHELEVVCIWSHISGKRSLYLNGREVHASKAAGGNTRFEHSWGIVGGHVLKFVGNAVPPSEQARRADPACRQFDLFLDGRSYFDFCKIYQLGRGGGREAEADAMGYGHGKSATALALRNDGEEATVNSSSQGSYKENNVESRHPYHSHSSYSTSRHEPRQLTYSHPSRDSYDDEPLQDEEVEDEREVMQVPPVSEVQVAPILDFFDAPAANTSPLGSSSDFLNDVDQFALATSSITYPSGYDEFSPGNVGAVNHERSFREISYEIMCAYNHTSGAAPGHGVAVPSIQSAQPASNPGQSHASSPTNHSPSYCTDLVPINEPNSVDAITKTMQSLVNLDDINSKPFQTLSNKNYRHNAHANNNNSNNNHKTTINNWNLVGRAPTLSEINASMNAPPVKKEIMRSHPTLPHYQSYAGPHPPLQQPSAMMMMTMYQQPAVASQSQPHVPQYAGASSGYYSAAY